MKNVKQRMIEDMKLRGLAPSTQKRYLDAVTALANHFHRRPDQISEEQIRNYLLYLIEPKGCSKNTFNVNLCAIRFLYQKTLGRGVRCLQTLRHRVSA